MKYLRLLPALLLCSCASETYTLGTANRVAHGRLQGNMKNVTVKATQNSYYMHADEIDNSAATAAGGVATGLIIDSSGNFVMKGGAAVMMGKAPGAISTVLRK